MKSLPLGKSCTALLQDAKVVPLCGFPAGALDSVAELLKSQKNKKIEKLGTSEQKKKPSRDVGSSGETLNCGSNCMQSSADVEMCG